MQFLYFRQTPLLCIAKIESSETTNTLENNTCTKALGELHETIIHETMHPHIEARLGCSTIFSSVSRPKHNLLSVMLPMPKWYIQWRLTFVPLIVSFQRVAICQKSQSYLACWDENSQGHGGHLHFELMVSNFQPPTRRKTRTHEYHLLATKKSACSNLSLPKSASPFCNAANANFVSSTASAIFSFDSLLDDDDLPKREDMTPVFDDDD